jgi:hypothetical protein
MLQASHSDLEKSLLNATMECAEGCYVSGNVRIDVHLSNTM